jgi:iron complex outermembrane recepter protein
MIRSVIRLSLMILPLLGFAQSKVVVAFKVIDKEKNSCLDVNLQKNFIFQYERSSGYKDLKSLTSTKCFNSYAITKIPGNFRIYISVPEYESQYLNFNITKQSKDTLYLGEVYLTRTYSETNHEIQNPSQSFEKEIEGVTVTRKRKKLIKLEANKTTYTIKDNDLLSGGSAQETLTKLPGVIKGYGGNLTVNGKSMTIYIDDVPTGLSGGDLENLLQSLPSNAIEKIEIISNPGASYDAKTGGGIINIITNGQALRGINGSASLNYQFNKNNRVSPSLSLNSRLKNVSLQLNSGFNYRENEKTTYYKREFTSFTPSVIFDQKNSENKYNRFYYFRPSSNIRFNKNSNLLINYNLSYTDNNNHYTGESLSSNDVEPINLLNSSKYSENNTNHELTTKYKIKMDTLGNIFDITASYKHFDKTSNNNSIQNNDGVYKYSVNDINYKSDYFQINPNFEFSLNKVGIKMNTGGKYSHTKYTSNGKYNLLNTSSSILDKPNYNSFRDFIYDENQYALYGEMSKKFDKLDLTAGVRYENLEFKNKVKSTDQHLKYTFEKFFPSFSLLYKFNPTLDFNATYRKSMLPPSYSNMDPNLTNYYDEFNTSEGNLHLKPDYYDNYEVSLSAWRYLKISFNYTYSKNINMLYYETEDNSLTVNQTTRTFTGMKNYNVWVGIPIPFKLVTMGKKFFDEPMNMDKMNFIYLYGMYNYYKVSDYPYLDKVKPMWFYVIYAQLILPKDFKLTTFFLSSTDKGYFEIYKSYKPFRYSNIELSRSFSNKTIKASLGIQNILGPTKFNSDINNFNLKTNYYSRDSDQLFYIKLSYSFDKNRNIKKENTIIDDDNNGNNNKLLPSDPLK